MDIINEADATPQIELTLANAKALGCETVEELTSKLRAATKAGETKETITDIAKALVDATSELTKATNAYTQSKSAELEEDRFEALAKEKIVNTFKSLPEDDPAREQIVKELRSAGYGQRDLALVLGDDDFKKTLLRPISKSNPAYEDHDNVRKAWDYSVILAATERGATRTLVADQSIYTRKDALQRFAGLLDQAGTPGAKYVMDEVDKQAKAMADANAGYGAEWIPTYMSGSMVEDIWLSMTTPSLFTRMPMTGPNLTLPIRTSRARAYLVDEATTDTAVGDSTDYFANLINPSSMGTSNVTFTARKLGAVIFFSDEIQADSIIPMAQTLREEITYAHADAGEDAIINGTYGVSLSAVQGLMDNASGTSGDRLWSDTGAGIRDPRAMFHGLRFSAFLSGVEVVDGAPSVAWATEGLDFYRNARKNMGKYGVANMRDLAWLITPAQMIELLKLEQVVTMEKFGNNATILSGEIGRLDGIPLLMSPKIPTNLNNKGFFSNGTIVTPGAGNGSLYNHASNASAAMTTSILVNRRGYAIGDRQQLTVESERQPLSGQRYVMAVSRWDFKKLFTNGEPLANLIVNLSV